MLCLRLGGLSPRSFLLLLIGSYTALVAFPSLAHRSPLVSQSVAAQAAFVPGTLVASNTVSVTGNGAPDAAGGPAPEEISLSAPVEEDYLTPAEVSDLLAQEEQAAREAREAEERRARRLMRPVPGGVSSPFGPRGRGFHKGVDLAAHFGDGIRAAGSGVVTLAGWYAGYGRTVIIDHGNGTETLYGHASRLMVTEGQRVERGQVIALVGSSGISTGPHLHFEVVQNGRKVNPSPFLP